MKVLVNSHGSQINETLSQDSDPSLAFTGLKPYNNG